MGQKPIHSKPEVGFLFIHLEETCWKSQCWLQVRAIMGAHTYPTITLNNVSDPFAVPQPLNGQKEDLEAKAKAKRGTRWLPTKLRNICLLMRHLAGRVKKNPCIKFFEKL